MKKLSLYGFVTIISILVRQFVLPNPFECFAENAGLINWLAEPILQAAAYGTVGIFYIKGSDPVLGSLLYLLTYSLMIGFLKLLGIFSFAWWWILIVIITIFVLIYGVMWLKERFW